VQCRSSQANNLTITHQGNKYLLVAKVRQLYWGHPTVQDCLWPSILWKSMPSQRWLAWTARGGCKCYPWWSSLFASCNASWQQPHILLFFAVHQCTCHRKHLEDYGQWSQCLDDGQTTCSSSFRYLQSFQMLPFISCMPVLFNDVIWWRSHPDQFNCLPCCPLQSFIRLCSDT
jgi:hypothetical protein